MHSNGPENYQSAPLWNMVFYSPIHVQWFRNQFVNNLIKLCKPLNWYCFYVLIYFDFKPVANKVFTCALAKEKLIKCGSIECKYWRRRWHTSLTMEIIIFLSKKQKAWLESVPNTIAICFKTHPLHMAKFVFLYLNVAKGQMFRMPKGWFNFCLYPIKFYWNHLSLR